MKKKIPFLFALSIIVLFACTKDQEDIILDTKTATLVSILENELQPL